MKKLLAIITGVLLTLSISAQTFTVPTKVVQKSPKLYSTDFREAEELTSPSPVSLQGFALQLTFTQLTKADEGWKLGNLFAVGESYLWTWGNGKFNPDSSITVESKLSLGFGFNFGIVPDINGVLVGALPIGGIAQYSSYGVFLGYDILGEVPMIGISYKIPNFPVLAGQTRFNKLPE